MPNAYPGRDDINLKIFGMQGVPREFVEDRVLVGARNFWGKVIAERTAKERQDKKPKDRTRKEKKEDVIVEEPEIEEVTTKYIKFINLYIME